MREKGFTLVEVLIVLTLIIILATIAIPKFSSWVLKYKIEGDVKKIEGILQEARVLAFTKKQNLTVNINNTQACINDGTSNIKCIDLDINFNSYSINIDKRGYYETWISIFPANSTLAAEIKPAYSCLKTHLLRVRLGEIDGTACEVK